MICAACRKDNPLDSRFCSACGQELVPTVLPVPRDCRRCGAPLAPAERFCPTCGTPVDARAPRVPPARLAPPPRAPGWHSPALALLLGLVLPGAGQAYNGQPVKGFFLFFASALVFPYFLSLWDAYATARRIRASGQSSGCGGFLWVGLQLWLAANTAVLVVLVLTVLGVLT